MSLEIFNAIEYINPASIQAGLALIAYGMAFSRSIKKNVKKKQGYRCAECGSENCSLEVHHRLPRYKGGSDHEDNAVALCPDDHDKWDEISLNEPTIYPGVSLDEAKDTVFKSKGWKGKRYYPDYY